MKDVLVIGSGVSGLFSAWYLNLEGYNVTVIDKDGFGNSCSFGNAGMIVPSHFIPLASPGVISSSLKWMVRKESPFSIKPGIDPDLARWLYLFYRSSNPSHVKRSAVPLLNLHLASNDLYSQLRNEIEFGLVNDGILMLFNSAEGEAEEIRKADTASELGLNTTVLDKHEIDQLEPDIDYNVNGGVFYPGDSHLDPVKLMISLKNNLLEKGVEFDENREVSGFTVKNGHVTGVMTIGNEISADYVIIAAGSRSGSICRMAGAVVPHMAGKGYSMVVENHGIKHAALLHEARVSVTPYDKVVRFGGTMEIGNITNGTNRNKVKGIIRSVGSFIPDYRNKIPFDRNVWYGLRSMSADGLPYIGRIRGYSNLFIASGHGMMGISLGPVSGRIIADLVTYDHTSLDVSCFDPNRFSRQR